MESEKEEKLSIAGEVVRSGHWRLRSKSDPRWDESGEIESVCFSGGWPEEARAAFKALKAKYGEPPADLRFSCRRRA
ncbi:MAG: hypothetical protein Q7S03_01105 [bacterium]|nr:hypothetical protein [bacterium]